MSASQPHHPRDQIADADPAARASDEQVLRWLRLRNRGIETPQIAAMDGVLPGRIRIATNRVREADEALDGAVAAAAYVWTGRAAYTSGDRT